MPKKGYITPPTKAKFEKPQEQKFSQVTSTSMTAQYHPKFNSDLEYLKKILLQWSILNLKFDQTFSQKHILKEYFRCHHELTQYDQFDSFFFPLTSLNVNLQRVQDTSLIFKSFDLFRKCLWPVRFTSKFVSRINQCTVSQIKYILGFIMMLADGKFFTKAECKDKYGYSKALQTKSWTCNRFFSTKIFREKNFIVHIGVEKIPILGKNNVIKRYQFKNIIQFLDILSDHIVQNPNKLQERMQVFTQSLLEDVAKRDHNEELQIDIEKYKKQQKNYFFYSSLNPYNETIEIFDIQYGFNSNPNGITIYHPVPFKVYYVSQNQTTTLIFDNKIKRWVSEDYLNKLQKKKFNDFQKQINEQMIKRFVDFQSAKTLVQLLTKIPNFKIQLTNQEKDVIGQNGNVLAIGRSGTGKTTCAVLRLFSIQMLFKIRLSLYKKKFKEQLKDTRCSADDIDKTMGLHCIFVTASPVLTNQIQRYYKKLTENIKEELQKKRKKAAEERKLKQIQQKNEQSFTQIKQEEEKTVTKNSNIQQQLMEEGQQILEIPQNVQRIKSAEDIQEEIQMKEQLKGIQLKENIQNEQFVQDEDEFEKAKEQFQEKLKNFHSLYDLEQKDYPGFFTVRSYIMMIDGVLPKPFFIRNKHTVQQNSKAAWHNQKKGVMMIENYFRNDDTNQGEIQGKMLEEIQEEINYSDQEELEHQYMRQIQLREKSQKQNLTKKLEAKKKKNNLSFQVDYDYFAIHFWPQVQKKFYSARNITPHLVWTQIYSTIKGSANSHLYPGQYLTQKAYIDLSSNIFLTKEEKLDVYETFCQYQRWKIRAGGYDIMDTVNYILNFIRFKGYNGPEIHYIMIDQVQDLPHAIVYLLSKSVTTGVFYSGDTAQTIAKGVGFRFCDLKSLFDPRLFDSSLKLTKPAVKQLTVNFRSHNNILQLANSVVSSLQILFPKTIDRLAKQRSNLKGPKPMILSDNDEEVLFYILCGEQQKQPQQGKGLKKTPLEFGCDQVIIVRDQQSKQKVPGMLQHALCLTIYEAKGLQFNDVILFNFFTESTCRQKWNLLKYIKVIEVQLTKQEYQRNFTKHELDDKQQEEKEPEQISVDLQCNYNEKNLTFKIKKMVADSKAIMKDINDYAELCSDLKLLYTAITRPKKTLIIYDEDPTSRKCLQRLWQNLDVIQMINKQIIQMMNKQQKGQQTQQSKVFRKIISSTDNDQWRKQGLKMYTRGYFEQAMKCFERSGHMQLFNKAKANLIANKATKKLIQVESERSNMKQGINFNQNISSSEQAKIKRRLKGQQSQALHFFYSAGKTFQGLKMMKQAGQCYFSGKHYQQSYEAFIKINMYKQAAQSLQMMGKYKQAAEYYQKEGEYLKIIECLDMINQWEQILEVIKRFEFKMTQLQSQSLLKKYASLALSALVYEIEFQNQQNLNDKPQNNRVEIIQQKQSQEQDEEDQELQQDGKMHQQNQNQDKMIQQNLDKKQENIEQINQKVQEVKQSVYQKIQNVQVQAQKSQELSFSDMNDSNVIVQSKQKDIVQPRLKIEEKSQKVDDNQKDAYLLQSIKDESFSDLNEPKTNQNQLKQIDESFGDLNQSQESSFSDFNIKYQKQLDPDVQSIKSLADPEDPWIQDALSEIKPNTRSEYSVLDQDQNYNLNVKIIKTKGNIFIQDQIMQKIIKIVSIINPTATEFFKQFKGYQSLITVSKENTQGEKLSDKPQISEFEDIDDQTINVILDTLQSFKLYKLCLFVCNRYHMPQKAGRYLISIIMKYSPNCQSSTLANPSLLSPSTHRKSQLQKGILASIAVHAVFQNISSDFLKIKISSSDSEQKQKNSLGTYFIQGLILQGLYKKTIFMLNPEQALHILSNFSDYQAYRDILKNKILKSTECQMFIKTIPKNKIELDSTIMSINEIIVNFNAVKRLDTLSTRFYKQFDVYERQNKLKSITIPEYLKYTKNLIQNNQEYYKFLDENIQKAYSKLLYGNQLQTMDIVSAMMTILHSQELQNQVLMNASLKTFLCYYRIMKYIRSIIYKIQGTNSMNIIRAVSAIYQCKQFAHHKSVSFMGSGFCLVHRTSILINDLIQMSKNDPNNVMAYFFQQDFNLVLTKLSTILIIIKKKFQFKYSRFIKKRIQLNRFKRKILPEDFRLHENEMVLVQALRQAFSTFQNKPKQKVQVKERKNKQELPKFDYRSHGKLEHAIILDESSEEQEQVHTLSNKRDKYVLPDFSQEMSYIGDQMLSVFLKQVKQSKTVLVGKELYCCNMNSHYREYVQKMGGFNLYDAVEFKKFKRVDLYSENILSILDSLPIIDKHIYTAEILILLLIQYKKMKEGDNFKIKIYSDYLKFLSGLKVVQIAKIDKQQMEKQDLHMVLFKAQKLCIFEYTYQYCSELNIDELSNTICDFLDIINYEEYSQFIDLPSILLVYLINLKPDKIIYQKLRRIITSLGRSFKNNLFENISLSKNQQDFIQNRQHIILKGVQMHQVKISCDSNIDKIIEQSQTDYQIQTKILNAKKKAALKISAWWKKNKVSLKLKIQKNIHNYFDYLLKKQGEQKQSQKFKLLAQFRTIQKVQDCNLTLNIPLLLRILKVRNILLTFYLSQTITSSLDFHYILITLKKIEDIYKEYLQICKDLSEGIISKDINVLSDSIQSIQSNIEVWKNDTKWLRQKNLDLKRKKVFQLKWMTKSLNEMKIIKKRAGLKKQSKLQLKKAMLKRFKDS